MIRRILLVLIRVYQLTLSPWFGPCCRFEPSCSRYAAQCVELHGVLRGSWLALRRLLRCHPFHPGGYDPPPLPPGHRARVLAPLQANDDRAQSAGRDAGCKAGSSPVFSGPAAPG